MNLTMRIESHQTLEGGAPLEFVAEGDGFEAGRDPALDWWLPDPSRFISSRHFEVTYRGGAYYITDCSTNGTFRVGETNRIPSPLQLYGGERFQVGEYVISVTLGDGAPAAAGPIGGGASAAPGGGDPWSMGGNTPAPVPVSAVVPDARGSRSNYDDEFVSTAGSGPGPVPSAPSGGIGSPGPSGIGGPPGMPPQPAQQSIPPQTAPAPMAGDVSAFVAAIAQGAGLPPTAFQGDPAQLGHEIGRSLRIVTEGLMALLAARAQAKTFVKSSSRTMMSFDDNNPMKFLPDASQALDAMFFNKRQGFLDGVAGFEDAMKDIKAHQAGVYAAIQPALAALLDDISPEAIEKRAGKGLMGSRRTALWDAFVERWDAKTTHHENGMLDVFLGYFSEAYDKATRKDG